ncbi:MAG TPA: CvpA family protein [Candidatus Limnocylindrales bacterium]|nr:CvpA family protein [Candidatus Limnocylindrales bacterium]
MDVAGLLRSLNAVDILILLILGAAFVLGFFQGLVRQLLGILTWFFSFTLAANLRDPLASWLSQYWTFFQPLYTAMLSFGMLYLLFLVVGNILAQVTYKHTPLFTRWSFLDEVMGGILGICLFVLILAGGIVVLDSFYGTLGSAGATDVDWVTALADGLADSAIADGLRSGFIPGLLTVMGPVLPVDVRSPAP